MKIAVLKEAPENLRGLIPETLELDQPAVTPEEQISFFKEAIKQETADKKAGRVRFDRFRDPMTQPLGSIEMGRLRCQR